MRIKVLVILGALVFVSGNVIGQNNSKFFYDTLTIMDYTTNAASERLSQLRKPIKRTFYLKNEEISYTLFKGDVASLTAPQIMTILDDGFSLYIDKAEHRGHKNLKPSILEVMDENNEVIEKVEDLGSVKSSTLKRSMAKGESLRFSGFIISVNEEKLGPITIDVKLAE